MSENPGSGLRIELHKAGKSYGRQLIFRELDYQFHSGNSYAILGPNGTGKSTLLLAVMGYAPLNTGIIRYLDQGKFIEEKDWYSCCSFTSPALELPEEFTLEEVLQFHFSLRKPIQGKSASEMVQAVGLPENAMHKSISHFSSGMKQRVRLLLAFFTDTPVLLLDEPCTNLDDAGVKIYDQLFSEYTRNRVVLVASNREDEYRWCGNRLLLSDFAVPVQ